MPVGRVRAKEMVSERGWRHHHRYREAVGEEEEEEPRLITTVAGGLVELYERFTFMLTFMRMA